MSMIISTNEAYHVCNWHAGCDATSGHYHYLENSTEIDEFVRREGWYVSTTNDTAYCPKHSPYNGL